MPIYRKPPALTEQSPVTEIFETGIKVIDLLTPYAKGGKIACSAVRAWERRCLFRS